MEHPVQVVGDAGLGQDVAHVDEQGQGQQRVPLEQLERGGERHFHAALPPEQQGGDGGDDADGGEHPLARQQHQQHGAEHDDGDGFVAHVSSMPRALARSLKKMEMDCSSMSRMPRTMMTLIGITDGFHMENSFWLVSMA